MPNLTPGYQIAAGLSSGRRRKQMEEDKFDLFKWADLYLKANDPAEKRLVLDMGRSFVSSLPKESQMAMKKTIDAGPFSSENMKKEQWKLNNPMPRIDADIKTSPYLYAEQVFRQKDWEAGMNKVVYGKDTFSPNLIGISENQYAMRDKDGNVSIYSKEEMEEKGKAQKLGIPLSQFVAGGGYAKTDETRTFINPWGASTKERKFLDLEGDEVWKPEIIDRSIKELEEDKALRRFHTDFLNMNTKENALVGKVENAMESEMPIEDIIDRIIAPVFPSYHFFPKGKYKDTIGGVSIKNFDLQFVKGTEVVGKKGDKQFKFYWSVDPQGKISLYTKTGDRASKPEDINELVKQYNIPIPPDFSGRL